MKYKILILVLLLFSIFSVATQALFGYDEFTDDNNQTIVETVENELGAPCSNCNVSFWISYPNGTTQGFYLMDYNSSSTKYERAIFPRLRLINQNTTIYGIRMVGNRTSGQLYNGTSDR